MKRMVSENLIKLLEDLEAKGLNADSINVIDDIIDSNGNLRFVEGDITPEEIEGITFSYAKWSLSGTHLMIAIAGSVADTTVIAHNTKIADISIPDWIYDKTNVIFGTNVQYINSTYYASDYTKQTGTERLTKHDNILSILHDGALTLTKDRYFRFQFDLLIDND